MKLFVHSSPKKGETLENNQDSISFDSKKKLFSVCDGVSRSSFSNLWSKIICEKFVTEPFIEKDVSKEFLGTWIQESKKSLEEKISKLDIDPMILDVAKDNGSATTFLGIQITKENNSKFAKIWAIGDSNAFQIRKKKIIQAFPIKSPDDFSTLTYAISSIDENNDFKFLFEKWGLRKNDILLFATDAFSKWFFESYLRGQKPWKKIIKNFSTIQDLIESQRTKNNLENDDTSFIMIQI